MFEQSEEVRKQVKERNIPRQMEYKNEDLEPGGYLECWGMAEEERVGAEEQQSERSVWTGREQVG